MKIKKMSLAQFYKEVKKLKVTWRFEGRAIRTIMAAANETPYPACPITAMARSRNILIAGDYQPTNAKFNHVGLLLGLSRKDIYAIANSADLSLRFLNGVRRTIRRALLKATGLSEEVL